MKITGQKNAPATLARTVVKGTPCRKLWSDRHIPVACVANWYRKKKVTIQKHRRMVRPDSQPSKVQNVITHTVAFNLDASRRGYLEDVAPNG